jgi:hypothetical protein
MGLTAFVKRRWAAHNARLLHGQLAVMKDAADPGGMLGGAGVVPGDPPGMVSQVAGAEQSIEAASTLGESFSPPATGR